ncbi:dTMP kinase [Candidatus Saccharibacteria bacterium]|nr:dTMP kinase [Candidatus Saccharibacteria bacterium]
MSEQTGRYIVIEGHDGTGKSTQVDILRERLATYSIDSVEFSEPALDPKDGNEDILIADALRTIIKNGTLERNPLTDLFLFSAARHEKWHRKAIPALALGKWVIASRNYYSTEAYQGYGKGLDLNLIHAQTLLATDERYMQPDIAVILNLENETERQRRIDSRGELETPDAFESLGNDFQSRVQQAYPHIAERYAVPIISAVGTPATVSKKIWAVIKPHIQN